MAAVKVVSYQPGDSALHRLDPRTKQIMVMVLSSACFAGGRWFLGMLTISIALCAIESRIGLIRLIREIRYFLVFLLFVFIIRALTFNDGLLPVLVVSQVQAALLFCWRLLLIVLMAVLLISTTPTGAIRAARRHGHHHALDIRHRRIRAVERDLTANAAHAAPNWINDLTSNC